MNWTPESIIAILGMVLGIAQWIIKSIKFKNERVRTAILSGIATAEMVVKRAKSQSSLSKGELRKQTATQYTLELLKKQGINIAKEVIEDKLEEEFAKLKN